MSNPDPFANQPGEAELGERVEDFRGLGELGDRAKQIGANIARRQRQQRGALIGAGLACGLVGLPMFGITAGWGVLLESLQGALVGALIGALFTGGAVFLSWLKLPAMVREQVPLDARAIVVVSCGGGILVGTVMLVVGLFDRVPAPIREEIGGCVCMLLAAVPVAATGGWLLAGRSKRN